MRSEICLELWLIQVLEENPNIVSKCHALQAFNMRYTYTGKGLNPAGPVFDTFDPKVFL